MQRSNLAVEILLGRWAGPQGRSMRPAEAGMAYRMTELATATPRRLRELLYDGAIRLCRQAVQSLDEGDAPAAADRLGRARAILRQLQSALCCEADGDLKDRLASLYEQAQRRLIDADFYRRRQDVSETILMLNYQRPAWDAFLESLQASDAPSRPGLQGDWLA